MAFGLNVNDISIEGSERVVATGSTGTTAGSVYVPNFDSNTGVFYNVSQEAGDGSLGIPLLSWNNSTKILSWSTPAASNTEDGVTTNTSYANSTYYCIQQSGGVVTPTGSGLVLLDPSGNIVVDGINSNQILSRSADEDFQTTLFSSTSITRAAVSGTLEDRVVSFVGRIFVGVFLYFFIEETTPTLDTNEYDGNIVVWKPKGDTVVAASNGAELAYLLSSANTSSVAEFGAEKYYLTTRKAAPSGDSGLIVNKNDGEVAYFSNDDSVRTVRVTTIANAQNLAIGTFIDLNHSDVADPAYLVSSTFPGYLRYVNSGNDTLIYTFGVRKISNTVSRAGWYLLTEVRSNRPEARVSGGSTGTFDVVVGVYDVSAAEGQPIPEFPPVLSQNSYSLNATQNSPFTFQFSTTEFNSNNIFTLQGSLPAGLSFNASTRTISGTPTSPATANLTISVSNSAGSDSASVSLVVEEETIVEVPTVPEEPNPDTTVPPAGDVTEFSGDYSISSASGEVNFGSLDVGDDWTISDSNIEIFVNGSIDITDNTDITTQSTVDMVVPTARFGDDLAISGQSNVIIYADSFTVVDNLRVYSQSSLIVSADTIQINDDVSSYATSSTTLISSGDTQVNDNISAFSDGYLEISSQGIVRINDDVTAYSNGEVVINSVGSVTINDRITAHSSGTITITSQNGNIQINDNESFYTGGVITLNAPNGTINVDGTNYGSSHTFEE